MDDHLSSFLSSWPSNSASQSYNFLEDSVESYGEGERLPSSSYFMRAPSADNLKFGEHDKNLAMFTNGCLTYNGQIDLFPGETVSHDVLPPNLPQLQHLQNNSNLQSNFMVQGILECNSTPGSFPPQLDTSGGAAMPRALSSSTESNSSEISSFLADAHAVSSAPSICSTFPNISSFLEPIKVEALGFQGAENAAMSRETGTDNRSLSQLRNVNMASLHDRDEFLNGGVTSLSNAQQTELANGSVKTQQQEQNGMHNLRVPNFVSGTQMAFSEAQGAQVPPKMPPWIQDPMGHPSDVQPQVNSAHGNVVSVKPRARARRGQATDPHSIAERLRREKISERMKNLQELVPNSNKTDKASMLDEIIDYVKFLQLQVKVLSMSRLGATGAVLPLLTESQTEGASGSPSMARGVPDVSALEDGYAFEQEVVKLLETSVTTAMQFLQNKGLCLMPIALASAISGQKGTAAAAIPPERRKAGSDRHSEATTEDGANGRSNTLESIQCARELKPRA